MSLCPCRGSRRDSFPSAWQLLPGGNIGFHLARAPLPGLAKQEQMEGRGRALGFGVGALPLTPARVGRRSSCPMEHPCIPQDGESPWAGPGVLGVPERSTFGGLLHPPTPARPPGHPSLLPRQERGLSRQNSSQGPVLPPPPCPPPAELGAPQTPGEPLGERRLSCPSPGTCHRYGAGRGEDTAAGEPPAPCPHAGLSPVEWVNSPGDRWGRGRAGQAGTAPGVEGAGGGRALGCSRVDPGIRALGTPPPKKNLPSHSQGSEPAMKRLEEDSEVYKMLQENRELRAAPRQSSTFRLLQEALEDEEGGEGGLGGW